MTRQQSATHVTDSNGAIVFVCRDPGRRGLVERLVQPLRTHAAAVDALLAVARTAPKAVLLNLEDVAGSEHDVLAALQRCRPHMPVYVLVAPQDEPLAPVLEDFAGGHLLALVNRVAPPHQYQGMIPEDEF